MTTKQIELPKNIYVLTECDDLFKLEKGNIIELDKKNELKELFKYPFRHLDLIIRIESSDKFIFIKSKMINNINKYMLTIFEKNKEKIYSVSFNFRKIEFKEDKIFLYGENRIDNITIIKFTADICIGIVNEEDNYNEILKSKEYINSKDIDVEITYCSYNKNVFILNESFCHDLSTVYMNDKEINSFGIMPYVVEREEGIFYQNVEFEWYYNDILLENIKGNYPRFGIKYILDYIENKSILHKLNDWFKCDKCNIKISKINTCDFCKIKFCDDCEPDNILFDYCKICDKSYCKIITVYDEYEYCKENKSDKTCNH